MAAILRDSTVAVVRTRPRAIPLAMTTMSKSTHGFPILHFRSGAPLSLTFCVLKSYCAIVSSDNIGLKMDYFLKGTQLMNYGAYYFTNRKIW